MAAAPIVNHAVLQSYVHQRVRVVGEVTNNQTGRVKVVTCDGKEVIVQTPPGAGDYSKFVCITGTWTSQGVLDETSHTNWGENLDLKTWNQVIELMHGTYSGLFVPGN